jgi:ElaB/YqjD/DUF883 family membrane-anchored ribosome-binding protein
MSEKATEVTLDQLRKDMDALRADLGALTETLRAATGNLADDAVRRVADGAARANAAVRNGAKVVQDTANKNITEHPLTSVAVAFGIGMVIGKLLDRR